MKKYVKKLGKDVECNICSKVFYVTPNRLEKNKTHTCSKKCGSVLSSIRLKKRVEVDCLICGKKMLRKASQHARVLHPACSVECKRQVKSLYNKGSNNPNFGKGTKLDKYFRERASSCNRRGKLMGWEHDITGEQLKEIYERQEGLCYYSKYPMRVLSKKQFDSLSVDRIDSTRGYTKDNIVLCCLSINTMKLHFDLSEVVKLMKSLGQNSNFTSVSVKVKNVTGKELVQNFPENSGIDLYVNSVEDKGDHIVVGTGIYVQPERGFYFDLVSRSSTFKKGLILYNNIGIIDQSYTGEIKAVFYKTSEFRQLPEIGDRLVQLVLRKCYFAEFIEVDELDNTVRGNGGFGSTGA